MNSLLAMFRFEWQRTMTASRIAWWLVLAAFPVAIVALIRFQSDAGLSRLKPNQIYATWSVVLYILLPCITSALGVFLSAAPAIAAELEQRSWVYMATRPNGIFWLLAGKYLVAVTWGFSASMAGILIAVPVSGIDSMFSVWLSLSGLCLLSSVSYAAVYLLIGVSFPQRAMVFCVAYTAAVEVAVSFIPAVINRITVQYRLRSLFLSWLQPELNIDDFSFFDAIAGGESAITEILWLLTLTALFFAAAIAIALRREFTAAAESDV